LPYLYIHRFTNTFPHTRWLTCHILGGAGEGIVNVNHCLFFSRGGERLLLGASVLAVGGAHGGEGAAVLCGEVRTQTAPINIKIADCVWLLDTQCVIWKTSSVNEECASLKRNSHNSSGPSLTAQHLYFSLKCYYFNITMLSSSTHLLSQTGEDSSHSDHCYSVWEKEKISVVKDNLALRKKLIGFSSGFSAQEIGFLIQCMITVW